MAKGIGEKLKNGKIKDGYILAFYLLLFFSVASVMAIVQPDLCNRPFAIHPPDEPHRYLVSRFICRYGRLPNGFDPEIRIPGWGISYGFYTMLPYMIQGYAMRFVNLFTDSELTLLYTARMVNVCTGTVMAAVVYGIGGQLFSDRRFKWLFCFLVMFLPQSLFLHSYVNTDSMALLSTAIIFYALVRAWRTDFDPKNCIILAVGIILCALSYYNAYGAILSSMLLFAAFYIKKEKKGLRCDWKKMLRRGALITGIVLLGIGWYFIRNAVLYDGDFLGLDSLKLCGEMYGDPATLPYTRSYAARGIPFLDMLKDYNFRGLAESFIAVYGSMTIYATPKMYLFYELLLAVGLAGFFLIPGEGGLAEIKGGRRVFLHLVMIFWMFMPLALCLYYAYSMDYQHQGRYLMPGLVPLMYSVTAGLKKLAELKWIPAKWGKIKKVMRVLAGIAIYAVMIVAVVILLKMVFACAMPLYRQAEMII